MRTAVDTNVISAIWSNEPTDQAAAMHLHHAGHRGTVVIAPFVLVELLAHQKMEGERVQTFLAETGIVVDFELSHNVWWVAGQRFREYAARRIASKGTSPRQIFADFLIGAHALLQAEQLATLDPLFFGRNFPELAVLRID